MMSIFKNAARLAIVLLGAGVSAATINSVMAHSEELVTRKGGPPGDLLANITHVICQPTNYPFAINQRLEDGITYLQGKTGSSQFAWQAGGKDCMRVSCEENSGIYVCNDNDHAIDVYYDTMAAYTRHLMTWVTENANDTQCDWYQKNVEGSPFNYQVTSGQVFDSNGFNVIVGMLAGTSC